MRISCNFRLCKYANSIQKLLYLEDILKYGKKIAVVNVDINTFATAIFVACLFVFGLAFALLLYVLFYFTFLKRWLLIAFLLRRNWHHVDVVFIIYGYGKMTEITPCSFHFNSLGQWHFVSGVIYIGVFDTTVDERFWDYLAGENQNAFEKSGADGKCIEAREFVIMLPPSLTEYVPQILLKLFTDKFKAEYGLDCSSALHHNKAKTNYHIHLIYSERRPLEKPIIKIASRNMFYDENGKHRKTKNEILDEAGNIKPGCKILLKGGKYDNRFFGPKEDYVKTQEFLDDVKHLYTDLINACVKDESERLTVFDRNGPYLATKKIGKNNPKADVIRADNEVRIEWNRTVDEARVAGIPEADIVAMKKDFVSSEVKKSFNDDGYRPDRLGEIIRKAIGTLIERIRKFKLPEKPVPVFDFAAYNEMVKTNNALRKIMAEIATIDKKVKHKQDKIAEYQGIKYRNFKITLNKEIAELLIVRKEKHDELDRIVKKAGYKNVSKFMTAFEKSCRLLEEYKAQHPGEELPTEKESVLSKLKSYQAEAKTAAQKDPEKQKKKETEQ